MYGAKARVACCLTNSFPLPVLIFEHLLLFSHLVPVPIGVTIQPPINQAFSAATKWINSNTLPPDTIFMARDEGYGNYTPTLIICLRSFPSPLTATPSDGRAGDVAQISSPHSGNTEMDQALIPCILGPMDQRTSSGYRKGHALPNASKKTNSHW